MVDREEGRAGRGRIEWHWFRPEPAPAEAIAAGPSGAAGETSTVSARSVSLADGWRPWADLVLAFRPAPLAGAAPGVSGPGWRAAGVDVRPAQRAARLALGWEWWAFFGALMVYALTRFWRLGEYPIYFFTDEAFQIVAAEDLLRHGLRDGRGTLLPLFFLNGQTWAPYLPVYFHALALSLFGKSPEVARGTIALLTVAGAGTVGLALRSAVGLRLWWTAPLILAVTPAWFLHSRTAFETVACTAFFAVFLLCFVLYRGRSVWYLYPAILCAALSFYSYLAGPTVTAVAGLLFLVESRYALRHRRHLLAGLLLTAVLAVPFLTYTRSQPAALTDRVASYSSYWLQPLPLAEKLRRYGATYAYGLSPAYWFGAPPDLSRHVVLGSSHLWRPALPFVVVGVAVCALRLRRWPYRMILLAALAAPFAAAVTAISITRVLAFVVPAAMLAAVGLDTAIGWLRPLKARLAVSAAAGVCLAGAALALLDSALTDGPRWDRDYGLYGQQWGAIQLFQAIPPYLASHPDAEILLSSNWANGTDVFPRFFLAPDSPQAGRVRIGNVADYAGRRRPLTPNTVFIMTPEDLEAARSSGKFATVEAERVIPYPDGRPGFAFVRLAYVPNLDAILDAERAARREPVEESVVVGGESVATRHSATDGGTMKDVFDGEPRTLARFQDINPVLLELRFPRPRRIANVNLLLAAGDWEVTARLTTLGAAGAPEEVIVTGGARSPAGDTWLDLKPPAPDGPLLVTALRLDIRLLNVGDTPTIHVRELQLS